MNGVFSWKDRSAQILSSSFKMLRKKHSLNDDEVYEDNESENEIQTDDEDENDDYEDLKKVDNSVFEASSKLRQEVLDQQPDLDLRLRRWRELTNIDVSPQLPPRRSKCFSESVQQILAKNGVLPDFGQEVSTVSKMKCEKDLDYTHESKIKFKFQYLIMTERLKVTIVEASNLLRSIETEKDIAVCIEVCLMPGKIEKQVTPLCKGTRNPTFDSVMYFNKLTLDEMHQMSLRIKINGRNGGKGSLTTVGEVTVSLDDFDIVGETLLEESVDTRIGSRPGCKETFRTKILRRN